MLPYATNREVADSRHVNLNSCIRVNLNLPIMDMDGVAVSTSLAKALGHTISNTSNLNPALKWYDWAMRLWRGEVLEVDEADYTLIIRMVEDSTTLTVLSKVQLLTALKRCKDPINRQLDSPARPQSA